MKLRRSQLTVAWGVGMLIAAALACGPSTGSSTATPASSGTSSGGATSGGGGINDIDPCHLLDQVNATTLFGHQANPSINRVGSNSASCLYTSATNGDLLTLNVLYEDGAAKDSSDYTSVRTSDTQPVPGLGDDAYFNKAFHLLTVAKGHWMFGVNAALGGTNQGLDQLTPLAQVVLIRLPY
jgi:hypothetical protein